METKNTNTGNTTVEIVKSKAELKFQQVRELALQMKTSAEAIKITDETTLQMANQLLSKIKEHWKLADKKREEMKAPYLEIGNAIQAIAKSVLTPLDEALDIGKKKLAEWNTIVEKQRQETIAAANKHKDTLDRLVKQIQDKADKCVTPAMCQQLIDSVTAKFPVADAFGPYAKEAAAEKSRYLDLLMKKRDTLDAMIKGQTGSTAQLEELKQTEVKAATDTANLAAATEVKKEEIIDSVMENTTKSNTRKTWVAEILDESKLPKTWTMPNMDVINAYAKSIKESAAGKEQIISGVKFYLKETVIIK